MNSPITWRRNLRIEETQPGFEYWDMYKDGEYQHAWITCSLRERKYALNAWDGQLGTYDSFADADAHAVALAVMDRFRRAG